MTGGGLPEKRGQLLSPLPCLLHFPFLIKSSKPLHYWYRGQKVASSICSGKEHLEASFCLVSYHA